MSDGHADPPDGRPEPEPTPVDQPPVSGQTPSAAVSFDGVTGFMGMRWQDPETVSLQIRPDLINRGGLLSGVVTYALVDYCMGSTLWAQTTSEERIATINISINYVETAVDGEIVCRSTLDRRNRNAAVMRSEVRHEDGRLLVTAIGSYTIFPPRRRAPGAPSPVSPS
jgi:acyl-coenzyme A thioesterase PaaI-like protein